MSSPFYFGAGLLIGFLICRLARTNRRLKMALEILKGLARRQEDEMATLDDVKAALVALNDKADAAKKALDDEIARVEALIAAGNAVTPADLQTIVDNLTGVSAKVDAISTEAAGERP